ncbi:estrogen receptor [Turdus rufiventris]|nr:estrogen receptor [Turdus rufiventris]
MTLHTKTSGVTLLHQIQGTELETLSRPQLKIPLERSLSDMYVETNKTGVFNYPEGAAYDFGTTAPVYSSTTLSYAPTSESFGSSSLAGFHSLNSVPPSPVVFLQTAPQLSPFIHHHSQQVPYYLENDQGSFGMREAAPPAFYRLLLLFEGPEGQMGLAEMTQDLLGNYTFWSRSWVSVRVTTWNTSNGIDSSIKPAHGPASYSETQKETLTMHIVFF